MAESTELAPFSRKDRGVIIHVRRIDCSLSGRLALYDISMTCDSSRIANNQGALRCAVVALIGLESVESSESSESSEFGKKRLDSADSLDSLDSLDSYKL